MPRVNREKVKQNEGVDLFVAMTTRILVGFNKNKHGHYMLAYLSSNLLFLQWGNKIALKDLKWSSTPKNVRLRQLLPLRPSGLRVIVINDYYNFQS